MRITVCEAIANRRCLSFTYNDRQRVIEPHLCARNEAGHDVVLGYLVAGYSASDAKPGWRNYLLSGMRDVEVLDEGFEHARQGFKVSHARCVVIYCQIEG